MQWMDIDGYRLETDMRDAPAEGPSRAPIVFLHEGLGSVAMWRDWPAAVCQATGRAGLVYSRRGYGRSEPTPDFRGAPSSDARGRRGRLQPDFMHHEALRVLPSLLDRVGWSQPVLLGHSDGASIALIHASRHPVTACIAMAPHVMVEDISIASITEARAAFQSGDLRHRLQRYHDDVDCAFWQWNDIWLDPAFHAFDLRADCRRIGAPVLALQGSDDVYGTLAQIEQIDLPDHQVKRCVLAQCGHSPHRDQPAQTTKAITEFLASLP